MVANGSLKKLQQRFCGMVSPRKPRLQETASQNKDLLLDSTVVQNQKAVSAYLKGEQVQPFGFSDQSTTSECPSLPYEFSEKSSSSSLVLSLEEYTLEWGADTHMPKGVLSSSQKDLIDFSAWLPYENCSRDTDLDLSLLSSIPGTTCSTQLITSPLNSTRHDDSIHSGIADITCSDMETTSQLSGIEKLPQADETDENVHTCQSSTPNEPLGPRPPCVGSDVKVSCDEMKSDDQSKTMTRYRKKHIKKSLKRMGRMVRHGQQNNLRTLALL